MAFGFPTALPIDGQGRRQRDGAHAGEPQRLGVAAIVSEHRRLGDNRASYNLHDRKCVRVAVRIDTDDVVQLICKHPYLTSSRELGDTTVSVWVETAGGRTVTGHALTTRTGF